MDKHTAEPPGGRPAALEGAAIIQFGIVCCAVTMVIVIAVAFAAG